MEYSQEWTIEFIHSSKTFTIDFIAGSLAGVAVTLSGHPFDTIKVRMQREATKRTSFIKNVKDCFNNEGVKGFYRGMGFPLCSVPLINATVFSVHELAKKVLGFNQNTLEEKSEIFEGLACGAVAGWANCFIVTPVELVKCRLQIQHEEVNNAYYKGVFDCILKTYKEAGIRGLYSGNIATILREIPAYSAQFGGYYYAKKVIAKFRKKHKDELNNLELMICGAVGGYACWQFSYPQDVIKTHLQTGREWQSPNEKKWDGGFTKCLKYLYSNQGAMAFWRGFLPCTLRALIANGVLFLVYENSKEFITDLNIL